MEIKKNPKSNLENFSKLFIQLGLVLALFVVYVSIEKKTYEKETNLLADVSMEGELEEDVPITERIEPEKPKAPPPPAPEKIEIVEDEKEVEETVIETTETDETEAIEIDDIEEEDEDDEVQEDVNFLVIEEVPIFPGCKGTRQQKSDCFRKKMTRHVNRKFNTDLASDLGLSPGKKKIRCFFRIDEKGYITEIQVKAPHPRLKKEAIRIIKLIPRMTPGKQRGKPVGMRYTLPISFNVE